MTASSTRGTGRDRTSAPGRVSIGNGTPTCPSSAPAPVPAAISTASAAITPPGRATPQMRSALVSSPATGAPLISRTPASSAARNSRANTAPGSAMPSSASHSASLTVRLSSGTRAAICARVNRCAG